MQKNIFVFCVFFSLSISENFKSRSIDLEIPSEPIKPSEINAETRIYWGQSATNGQFPFAAYLLITRTPAQIPCTGSIIGSIWILSARRCFLNAANQPANSMQAFVGNVDWQNNQAVTSFASWAVWPEVPSPPHPQLLIFRLNVTLPSTQFISPIRLPRLADENFGFDGVDTTVLGWGTLGNGTIPRILQFGSFRVLAVHLCFWNPDFGEYDFCSQNSMLNNWVSNGDWGGASIFWENDGQPTIIGVTSNALSYPNGVAAISTRVSTFLRFINFHTGIPFR